MNGGRTEYNNWELDGGDNMDNGSNGTLNVYPSVDSISEFKVLTSAPSTAATVPEQSKLKPRAALVHSTVMFTSSCATTCSMR